MALFSLHGELARLQRLDEALAATSSRRVIRLAALRCLLDDSAFEGAALLTADAEQGLRACAWEGMSTEFCGRVDEILGGLISDDATVYVVRNVADEPQLLPYREALRAAEIGSLVLVAMRGRRSSLGWLLLRCSSPRAVSDSELGFIHVVAGRAAEALLRVQERDRARAAEARAEIVGARLQCLHQVTTELSRAITLEQVAAAAVTRAVPAIGAQAGALYRFEDGLEQLALVRSHGYTEDVIGAIARVPLDSNMPAAEAFRGRRAMWVEDAPSFRMEHPEQSREVKVLHGGAFVCIPISAREVDSGVMVFTFAEARRFDAGERAFLETITHHMAHAIERARLFDEVERAVRSREEVLGIVAHDLRTPLSVVAMTAGEALSEAGPDSRSRARASRLLRNTHRMELLIRDLLDFSQIETGRLSVDMGEHSLGELLQQALETAQVTAADRAIELDLSDELAASQVRCDRDRVMQVLGNLLGNAIKFTAEGGHVRLQAESEGPDVIFSVHDTGCGISSEELPNLFERYWQSQHQDDGAHSSHGVGLGLFIAKALVELQGGRIWAESELGAGSVFSFSLKRVEKPAQEGARATVLVVDDDTSFRREVCEILEFHGYRAVEMMHGRDALAYLASYPPPDLILLDLMMPQMDGWEFYAHLKMDPKLTGIPTVILSCLDRGKAGPALADAKAHLEKPVRMSQLIEVTRTHCQASR
ncbi:hybrid sensor histidine kinase/response regulator [Haliangium ochraceum]|uniref:histidine kinase n=1 Tax=Haliangium ochraceum (strain DSM 14365 / JCM 11303 / SMP-2) TaxID=502025 RepID=D0LHU4_HALO1|nr:ATP-binding protein [Haliangium ochraceum]ACY14773.1 GAF sensor hybrid histidine kinase [Haliangium ochraceum DSM 14365]